MRDPYSLCGRRGSGSKVVFTNELSFTGIGMTGGHANQHGPRRLWRVVWPVRWGTLENDVRPDLTRKKIRKSLCHPGQPRKWTKFSTVPFCRKCHAWNFRFWLEAKSCMHETYTFDSKSKVSCRKLPRLIWSQKLHAWSFHLWLEVKKVHAWNFQCWLEVESSMHETSTVTLKSKVSCMTLSRLTLSQKLHAWSFRFWLEVKSFMNENFTIDSKSKFSRMKRAHLTWSQDFNACNFLFWF